MRRAPSRRPLFFDNSPDVASGSAPIVEDFEFNVDGTLSAWDIGDGTILEAWR